MAGDWIKMRTSLLTNPKVNGIARELESSSQVSDALTTGYKGKMSEVVTRNVMRHVTVSSLLVVWGAANEHTKDGVFIKADLSDIDDMVGIPGFGHAMEVVGWAVYDEESNSVTLPNFNEYNTSGQVRSAGARSGAERQKEYRERKKTMESNVTNNVTRNRREEKIRKEINTNPKGLVVISDADDHANCPHQQIIDLYHNVLPMCPQIQKWTVARARQLRARWNEDLHRQNLDWWRQLFKYIATSEFLTGRTICQGKEPFFADLEWITKSANLVKIIEGKYENRVAA